VYVALVDQSSTLSETTFQPTRRQDGVRTSRVEACGYG